ncbi:Saposin-like type B, region 1 family protein [Trichomonas vaginalis G3]|uniref:Saposin-like type B, region 1 family protein n=1 Tax=Trichomonas vaginalis (strain ATCC PRA-98 / G3) TaxID=412133 RepID=A2ES80_TRIV3|nr:saposin (B) domains-containing protein [Trichomonas vaginalis G3]EAY04517.1 Saposin-like type B, region 1 family protein [Trichomonas vaginalis G3]KAI5503257.1 saposin (B) domains-containing protein [Trichomonas vaginalis G3]|eukprot:XP_001316740.1 Saposin-like type B, region 1 family protein [Trichomonas vaginalis G3]
MLAFLFASAVSFKGECQVCKFAAEIAKDLLLKEYEKAEIPQLIEKECKKLPAAFQSICTQLAMIPIEEIVKLAEKTTPTEICEKVKLCRKVRVNARNSLPRAVYSAPVANGRPAFSTETNPQWQVSWEEAI